MTPVARPKISVCMAAFNGALYIAEQLDSILSQLAADDEVVLVDDASSDETLSVVARFQDRRIRVLCNTANQGVVRSFEIALAASTGEIIFLSDQDDRWFNSKVLRFLEVFSDPAITLAVSNALLIDSAGQPLRDVNPRRLQKPPGLFSLILTNTLQGSLMAFRRSLLQAVLPLPPRIGMHDWWIGCANAIVGRTAIIDEPLVWYRRHASTVTTGKHRSNWRMASDRARLLWHLMSRFRRLLHLRKCFQGLDLYT